MPMPSNPGEMSTGSSRATCSLPKKPPWCGICPRVFGKATSTVPVITSSGPMQRRASKPGCGVTPAWVRHPANPGPPPFSGFGPCARQYLAAWDVGRG
jgi:hypothetical protein